MTRHPKNARLVAGVIAALCAGLPPAHATATPEGTYAVTLVDPDQYRDRHQNWLYTHLGHSRFSPFGAEHGPCRNNIQAIFESYGLPVELNWFDGPYGQGCNVIAEVTGTTRPDDVYIIGAHYDSYTANFQNHPPGADDNASGVALVLEVARLVSQWGSDATIRFIAFDAEEWGLVGSDFYAGQHENDNILGMIAIDMIAYRATPHNLLRMACRDHSLPLQGAVAGALADYAGLVGYHIGVEDRSDHAPFEWRGFQATRVGEPDRDINPNYHQPTDAIETYAYIDYDFVMATTRGVLGWLVDTAGVYTPTPLADLNCDYQLDFDDINPFIVALAGQSAYEQLYPLCRWLNGDANGDGTVNVDDVDTFVALLAPPPTGLQVTAQITPSDATADGSFGSSVALDGDTLVIGARGDDEAGTGAGAAYVYTRAGDTWTQVVKLTPTGPGGDDFRFGFAVALEGDVLVIGAPRANAGAEDSGRAEVFERVNGVWTYAATLVPADPTDTMNFGFAVSVHGHTVAIGAPFNENIWADAGAAYVFQRQAGTWTQVQKLAPPEGFGGSEFGYALAITSDRLLIGAPGDPEAGPDGGSVSIYEPTGGEWLRTAKLLPTGGPGSDRLGMSVAIRGDSAAFGGYFTAMNAGSAYIFEFTGGQWWPVQHIGPYLHSGHVALAMDGDQLILGRPTGDVPLNAGRVYLYEQGDIGWALMQQVAAPSPAAGDALGYALALQGTLAVVGAPARDTPVADSGTVYVVDLSSER